MPSSSIDFSRFFRGPFLVMLAAALWAADALLRTQLTTHIPSAWIVFLEHIIGFLIMLPLFVRAVPRYRTLRGGDWVVVVALTIVSSVAGTLFFTEALARSGTTFDFITPVLLQKLQPIFVVLLAVIFLRERISFFYALLVPVALIGSYLISFGAFPVEFQLSGKELVYILSLGAALAWGSGTILSKKILQKLSFADATALRFLVAIPVSFAVGMWLSPSYHFSSLVPVDLWRFVIIAFTTGAGAVLIYYQGLARTSASVATIAELTFPVVSLGIAVSYLNPYGAPQVL